MSKSEHEVIRSYYKRLQMELIVARFIERVPLDWGRPMQADDHNRLYLILGGEGRIQVGRHQFQPVSGQLVFLPAGTPLTYSTVNANTYSKYWCHFTAKVGGSHLSQLIDFPYVVQVADMSYVKGLFDRLIEASETSGDMTSPLRANVLLFELLTYYMEHTPPGSIRLSSSPDTYRSNQILQYIEEHLSGPLTSKQLAEAFHYNPNYFSRYFRSLFRQSPNEYINRVRMERAKWLLTHSTSTIEEIAGQVGLERFYFSNLFKRFTSLSPSEYRNTHQTGSP